jgi:hypothetical protein
MTNYFKLPNGRAKLEQGIVRINKKASGKAATNMSTKT